MEGRHRQRPAMSGQDSLSDAHGVNAIASYPVTAVSDLCSLSKPHLAGCWLVTAKPSAGLPLIPQRHPLCVMSLTSSVLPSGRAACTLLYWHVGLSSSPFW